MMVKPDQLTLDSLVSRKGYTGEVRERQQTRWLVCQMRCTAAAVLRASQQDKRLHLAAAADSGSSGKAFTP